jgi:hypothetical protein
VREASFPTNLARVTSNVVKYYSATSIVYHKHEIKNLILRNLVKQVWLLIFY